MTYRTASTLDLVDHQDIRNTPALNQPFEEVMAVDNGQRQRIMEVIVPNKDAER